jgi:hypothetical protein
MTLSQKGREARLSHKINVSSCLTLSQLENRPLTRHVASCRSLSHASRLVVSCRTPIAKHRCDKTRQRNNREEVGVSIRTNYTATWSDSAQTHN